MKRALLFLVGVGMIFGMILGVPARFTALNFQIEIPWPDFQMGVIAGCLMVVLSLTLPLGKRKVVKDEFDAEARERWRRIEEEQQRQREKKGTEREERMQKFKAIKEEILGNVKALGFCEIKDGTRSLENEENVPLNAKVHEVIPAIREVAAAHGVEMSYMFVMYDGDIPTMNIELSFLEDALTIGPQIPL